MEAHRPLGGPPAFFAVTIASGMSAVAFATRWISA